MISANPEPLVKPLTVEAFDQLAALPANADRLLEYIAGEIIEVPSNAYVSALAMKFALYLGVYLQGTDDGHLTGQGGGYMVSGERYAPDVAYISKARQPELARQGYNPTPPELAIEVVSPDDDPRQLMVKIGNYLAAGTTVWVAYPDLKQVHVYVPGQPVQIVGMNGTLSAEHLLPGFTLAVKDVFREA